MAMGNLRHRARSGRYGREQRFYPASYMKTPAKALQFAYIFRKLIDLARGDFLA
jgi:hypothetical protein